MKLNEILAMSDDEFEEWLAKLRKEEEGKLKMALTELEHQKPPNLPEVKEMLLKQKLVPSTHIFMTEDQLRDLRKSRDEQPTESPAR